MIGQNNTKDAIHGPRSYRYRYPGESCPLGLRKELDDLHKLTREAKLIVNSGPDTGSNIKYWKDLLKSAQESNVTAADALGDWTKAYPSYRVHLDKSTDPHGPHLTQSLGWTANGSSFMNSALFFGGASGGYGEVFTNTADGSDFMAFRFVAGGAGTNDRGAAVALTGNEWPTVHYKGTVVLRGGNPATGGIYDGSIIVNAPGNGTDAGMLMPEVDDNVLLGNTSYRWQGAHFSDYVVIADQAYQTRNSSEALRVAAAMNPDSAAKVLAGLTVYSTGTNNNSSYGMTCLNANLIFEDAYVSPKDDTNTLNIGLLFNGSGVFASGSQPYCIGDINMWLTSGFTGSVDTFTAWHFHLVYDSSATGTVSNINLISVKDQIELSGGSTKKITNLTALNLPNIPNVTNYYHAQLGAGMWKFTGDQSLVNSSGTAFGTITSGGAVDLGGAESLEIPNAASPTVNAEGEIAWDTDDDKLIVYDGAQAVVAGAKIKHRSVIIKSSVTTDDFLVHWFPRMAKLLQVQAIAQGGTNVVGCLDEYQSDGTTLVAVVDSDWTITTSKHSDVSFSNDDIAAGGCLKWRTTSVSGTVNFLLLTIYYYEV